MRKKDFENVVNTAVSYNGFSILKSDLTNLDEKAVRAINFTSASANIVRHLPQFTKIDGNLHDADFYNKINLFENAILNYERINLIMGASYVSGLNSESFSSNWTKFDGGGQNIYESYKFLKHYVEKTVIDTILIGINPFDFRDTIYNGFVNGNSFAFGIDSTNWGILKNKILLTT